jgi:hypothetical protein
VARRGRDEGALQYAGEKSVKLTRNGPPEIP